MSGLGSPITRHTLVDTASSIPTIAVSKDRVEDMDGVCRLLCKVAGLGTGNYMDIDRVEDMDDLCRLLCKVSK